MEKYTATYIDQNNSEFVRDMVKKNIMNSTENPDEELAKEENTFSTELTNGQLILIGEEVEYDTVGNSKNDLKKTKVLVNE